MFTLIIGLPNAGKTTYAKRFDNVLHLDEIGTTDKVCRCMAGMHDVVIEGVFNSKKQRAKLLAAYKGDHKRCVFLDVSHDEIVRRENRGRPSFILRNAVSLFEPPTFSEGWDEIIIIDQYGEETHVKGSRN